MKKIFINIKIIIFLLIYFIPISTSYSEILKKIEVFGNDRLADETIILFSDLNINDDINSKIIIG